MKRRNGARARLWVWMAGTVFSLGYYFVNAIQLPRRTTVGVERRLFGLGDLEPRLMESPSGGQWVLAPREWGAYGAAPAAKVTTLRERMRSLRWPSAGIPYRQFAPFQVTGTWRITDGSLSRTWSLAAKDWLDGHRLWHDTGAGESPLVLDLTRRRVTRGNWLDVVERYYEQGEEEFDLIEPTGGYREEIAALSPALEALPADDRVNWQYRAHRVGRMNVNLVMPRASNSARGTTFAITDDPAPRILRLAVNAEPRALGRDGRTFFFRRDGALWRLDLRRPLPALLSELPAPALPDPLASQRGETPGDE